MRHLGDTQQGYKIWRPIELTYQVFWLLGRRVSTAGQELSNRECECAKGARVVVVLELSGYSLFPSRRNVKFGQIMK